MVFVLIGAFFLSVASLKAETVKEYHGTTDSNKSERSLSMSDSPVSFPILQFTPGDGQKALLNYKLTELERTIFQEMDKATVNLPQTSNPDEDLRQCYEVITPIGAKYGLDRKQSIAFWTRATFSLFEKD